MEGMAAVNKLSPVQFFGTVPLLDSRIPGWRDAAQRLRGLLSYGDGDAKTPQDLDFEGR